MFTGWGRNSTEVLFQWHEISYPVPWRLCSGLVSTQMEYDNVCIVLSCGEIFNEFWHEDQTWIGAIQFVVFSGRFHPYRHGNSYPSGLLALVLVVTKEKGRVCIVYDDSQAPSQPIRAVFQSDGKATCYYNNGNIWYEATYIYQFNILIYFWYVWLLYWW